MTTTTTTTKTEYTQAQLDRIERLAKLEEGVAVPMAIVDYLGRRDADGLVTERTCMDRRFGSRDMRHVAIYDLRAVRLNPAAIARGFTLPD